MGHHEPDIPRARLSHTLDYERVTWNRIGQIHLVRTDRITIRQQVSGKVRTLS